MFYSRVSLITLPLFETTWHTKSTFPFFFQFARFLQVAFLFYLHPINGMKLRQQHWNKHFGRFNFCSSVSRFSLWSGERDPQFCLVLPTSQPLPITDSIIYLMLCTCSPSTCYLHLSRVKISWSYLPRAFVFEGWLYF